MKDLDKFQKVLESLRGDGKYRVFNSILRERGNYPRAIWYSKIWSKEDYKLVFK